MIKVSYMDRLKIADILPQQINLNQIDDSSGPYSMSYGFNPGPLAASISRIGLINSPILAREGKGGAEDEFVVVSGFRRIRVLKKLNWTKAPCRVLPEVTSPLKCLLLNLYENLPVRNFNAVEMGMALTRLAELLPKEEVVKDFMPLFDLPSHEETLHLFMRIETTLETQAKDLVARGSLSLQAAKLLLEMDSAARQKICRYFSTIKFNKNQQAQFMDFVNDLSHIEDNPISGLLDEPDLTEIRHNERMNSPQKARALIKLLRARRLPHLVKTEKRFRHMVENLALPAGCQITPPPYFEGPNYKLEIFFKEGKDLRDNLVLLGKKEGLAELEDPWKKGA